MSTSITERWRPCFTTRCRDPAIRRMGDHHGEAVRAGASSPSAAVDEFEGDSQRRPRIRFDLEEAHAHFYRGENDALFVLRGA